MIGKLPAVSRPGSIFISQETAFRYFFLLSQHIPRPGRPFPPPSKAGARSEQEHDLLSQGALPLTAPLPKAVPAFQRRFRYIRCLRSSEGSGSVGGSVDGSVAALSPPEFFSSTAVTARNSPASTSSMDSPTKISISHRLHILPAPKLPYDVNAVRQGNRRQAAVLIRIQYRLALFSDHSRLRAVPVHISLFIGRQSGFSDKRKSRRRAKVCPQHIFQRSPAAGSPRHAHS